MKSKNHLPHNLIRTQWSRFTISITVAIGLAFTLLFVPIQAETTIQIPLPTFNDSSNIITSGSTSYSGQTINLSLPFGIALVHATNGLTITKTAAPTVDQGSVLTYSLVIMNQTGEDLTRALVTDTISSEATCLSTFRPPSPPNPFWTHGCVSPSAAEWSLVYLPPFAPIKFVNNTSNVLTYTVIVDQPLPDQSQIVNNDYTIVASGTSTYSDVGVPLTTIVNAPNWFITKTVSSETIQPGEFLTYTITVVNDGHLATSGVYTITDPLPTNTDPSSASIQSPGFLNGNIVTWVLSDSLPALGGSKTLTYAVQVTTPLTNGEVIVNENYNVSGGNVFSSASGAPITVTVASSATLTVGKTADPDPVQAGDLLTYTITITNEATADGPALGVVVSDTLPAEVIYQSSGFVSPASGTIDDSGNPILWSLTDPLLVGDSVQLTVTVRVNSPLLPGLITNTVTAAAANASPVSTTLTTQITATNEITLGKSVDPDLVAPGDTVTYTIAITNSGNSIATVDLADLLAAGFTPATFSLSNISAPGRTLSTTEQVTTVVFTATTPLTPGLYFNQVVTATHDSTQTAITDTAPVRVALAEITLVKLANVSEAGIGETITYTYFITNSGDISLTNLSLNDDPLGSISLGATTLNPTESTSGTATTVVSEANLPGPIVNTATVTGTYLAVNQVVTTTTESVAITYTTAITIAKSFAASAGVPASIGDTITYTYRLTNTGTVTLYTVTLSDDKLGPLTVSTLPLAPGESTAVTATTTVVAGHLPGPLTNTVTVTGTNILTEATPAATDTASVPLTYTVAITIDKTANPTTATVGDQITYTYRITNTGQVTLTGVVLFDDELGTFPPISNTLGPGQSATASAVKTIVQADLPGPVTNTATVTGTNIFGFDTAVATDTASVTLTSTTAISLEKSVNVSTATLGQVIIYTYLITNSGNVDLTNITLVDDKVGPITSGLSLSSVFPKSQVITASYLVSAGDFPSPLVNTAVVTGENFAGAQVSDTAVATVTLVYTPGITLDKTANASIVAPGQTITYTYTVTNTGNVTLTNIAIGDDRLGPIAPAATTLPPNSVTTGTATYTVLIGDFPAVVNTAIVTGDDIFGLLITDTDTLTVSVQEPLTAITVTNSSPTIVNSTTFFTVTTNITSGVTYTWNFGDGTPPAILGQTPNHVYTSVGTYTVVVTASSAINSIVGTTVVTITPGPVNRFVLTANSPQTAGVPFTITITAVDVFGNVVTNFNGPATISDSTGTINPTTANLVNGTVTTNFVITTATAPNPTTITAISGTISGTVQVVIQPNTPTTLTVIAAPTPIRICQTANVTATLTDQFGNPTPGQPLDLQILVGPAPAGTAVLLPPTSGSTNSGGIFTTTLQATGAGNVRVRGEHVITTSINDISNIVNIINPALPTAITVTVAPPSVPINNSAIVSAQVTDCRGLPVSGSVITFTIASLGSLNPVVATTNASGIATSTVTAGPTPGVTTITGTAEGPIFDTTPFTITGQPVLTITKTANPPAGDVETGDTIQYQLVVTNNGLATANNIIITDTLDSDVGFVSGSITPVGSGPFGSSVITFSVPSLNPGASVTATIQVTVTAATSGTTIANNATASSQAGNIGLSNTVTHRVVTPTISPVFLPIVMKGFASEIDLTVVGFSINPANPGSSTTNIVVTVVVQNQGNVPTGEGFWTDFYVDPVTLPNNPGLGRDRRWDNPTVGSDLGIAWEVPPLAAGEVITLTSDGSGGGLPPASDQTVWDGTLPAGSHTLYAFVDSFDADDPTGPTNVEVVEINENNNMSNPINISIASGLGNAETTEEPLPKPLPRPDIGR